MVKQMVNQVVDKFTGELLPDMPFVRTPYNYDRMAASDESGLACRDPSRASQEFREDSDINVIVERFGITGRLPESVRLPEYGDFTGVGDYKSAMDALLRADESFMRLPADIRARFDNSPQVLLEFCSKEENREELAKLGLLRPGAVPDRSASPPEPPAPKA